MFTTEIIELVELVRSLLARKSEIDKEYFLQFVEPAWGIFTKIHENYKESLQLYSEILTEEKYPIDDLIEKIRRDSIYTADSRVQLEALMSNLPRSHKGQRECDAFAAAILEYFRLHKSVDVKHEKRTDVAIIELDYTNWPRYGAIIYLTRKGGDGSRADARKWFDGIGQLLRVRYEEVAHAYYLLRAKILS